MDRKVAKSDYGIVSTNLRDGSWFVVSSGSEPLSGVWSIVMCGGHGMEVMEVSIWDELDDLSTRFGGILTPTCATGMLL